MGFDLYGLAQKSDSGKYFRNNIWYWHPLWSYVGDVCEGVLSTSDIISGNSNSGHQITEKQALLVAKLLQETVVSGELDRYIAKRNKEHERMLDEQCDFCNGKGIRNDSYVKGKCNACKGKGKVRPHVTEYHFEKENVLDFIKFCRASGGFEIF